MSIDSDVCVMPYREALVMHNAEQVGTLIRDGLGKNISFKKLEELAKEYGYANCTHALDATKSLEKLDGNEQQQKNFLEVAFFIETRLQQHIDKNEHFLFRRQTNLPFRVEYDPTTKRTFIHTRQLVGKGFHKKTKKSYEYDRVNPQLIAHSVAKGKGDEETAKFAIFKDVPNVLKTRGISHYTDPKGQEKVSYKTLLHTLGEINEQLAKKLTTDEAFQVALDVINGVKGMHDLGYIHRDLHPGNIFVNKVNGNISANIGDLGQAESVQNVKGKHPCAYPLYNPPEILSKNISKIDYQKAESFSLGLILYEVVFKTKAAWFKKNFFSGIKNMKKKKKAKNHEKLCKEIKSERKKIEKLTKGKSSSKETRLQNVVRKLLHQDFKKRFTVTQAQEFLKA
jgi:serine/threonine protein kinase